MTSFVYYDELPREVRRLWVNGLIHVTPLMEVNDPKLTISFAVDEDEKSWTCIIYAEHSPIFLIHDLVYIATLLLRGGI